MSIVKYSTSNVPNTIRANNVAVGINNVGYGPTNTTGFYSGINVPSGGYVIYRFPGGAGQPNVYVAQNDTELINLAGRRNATTITEAISHINGLSNTIIMDRNYENIVTDGLILNLDPGALISYPRTGVVLNDISGNGNNGTLTNGPTFNSENGGSIVFDGVNDYINFSSLNPITSNNPFTLCSWLNVKTHSTYGISLFIGNATNNQSAFIGYVAAAQNGTSNSIGGGIYGTNLGSGILPNTGWHYVTLSYNSSNVIIYVDGISRTTRSAYNASLTNTSIQIGRANIGTLYPFNGNVGASQIYNRTLSSTEITQNYNATKGRFGL